MMDCLYAKCIPIITDCVMAELEKLGQKYRIALRIARDERWERLQCGHKGTYADDCIVDRIIRHKIYIVATNDRDLKRRIRKIPGVPIMSVARGKYLIERLPGECVKCCYMHEQPRFCLFDTCCVDTFVPLSPSEITQLLCRLRYLTKLLTVCKRRPRKVIVVTIAPGKLQPSFVKIAYKNANQIFGSHIISWLSSLAIKIQNSKP